MTSCNARAPETCDPSEKSSLNSPSMASFLKHRQRSFVPRLLHTIAITSMSASVYQGLRGCN